MTQRGWAVLGVVGVILALVSLLADPIGLGGEPRFGWKQWLGLVSGIVVAIVGAWQYRAKAG
jgi:uncharacterized membrane protein